MIKSKLYLIRGDGNPIYVGFTNRPIKQRFTEHKADKDFSGYSNITIEKLDELDYEFTWDEDILYRNANEVSVREAQLVLDYGTQDSKYQRAIGGGQVWNYEKWFVSTNKDNPKFRGMSSSAIEEYIQSEHDVSIYMCSFVSNMELEEEKYLHNFVKLLTNSREEVYLKSFVGHMSNSYEEQYLSNFVAHIIPQEYQYLYSFVGKLVSSEEQYLRNFTRQLVDPNEEYIKSIVKHLYSSDELIGQYYNNFVSNMREPEEEYLRNFITNLKESSK